jgi:primosomal protein N'
MKIVDVVFNIPIKQFFSYAIENNIEVFPSQRVLVPFGKQKKVGWIIRINNENKSKPYKYKNIIKIYDNQPIFPERLLDICKYLADVYSVPLGQIFYYLSNNISVKYLPSSEKIYSNKNISEENSSVYIKNLKSIVEFYNYSDRIDFLVELSQSVSGSQIYVFAHIHEMKKFYKKMEKIFSDRVILLFGGQNKKEKTKSWFKIINSENSIVIGTRIALFAPLKSLKLIVVDEPEDFAHKETRMPRYYTRDISLYINEKEKVPLVFSSIQPDIFEFNLIQEKKMVHFVINERKLPEVLLVPLKIPLKKSYINEFSRHIMEKTILENGKVVIINNSVKWNDIIFEKLLKEYPDFSILKINKQADFVDKSCNIFIGTETIINYLEEIMPKTVIFLNGDITISGETFQTDEKIFLLIQKTRKKLLSDAKILIQTYNPQLPVYQSILKNDTVHFYDYEISIRKKINFPPFCHIIKIDFPVSIPESRISVFCNKIEKYGDIYEENFKNKTKNSILWKVAALKSSMEILEKIRKEEKLNKIKIDIDPV